MDVISPTPLHLNPGERGTLSVVCPEGGPYTLERIVLHSFKGGRYFLLAAHVAGSPVKIVKGVPYAVHTFGVGKRPPMPLAPGGLVTAVLKNIGQVPMELMMTLGLAP